MPHLKLTKNEKCDIQMSDIHLFSYSENCYFLHPSILICNDQSWLISNLQERGFFTAGVRQRVLPFEYITFIQPINIMRFFSLWPSVFDEHKIVALLMAFGRSDIQTQTFSSILLNALSCTRQKQLASLPRDYANIDAIREIRSSV